MRFPRADFSADRKMEIEIKSIEAICQTCQKPFHGVEVAGVKSMHCDDCVSAYDKRMKSLISPERVLRRSTCVPQGYTDFDIQALPEATRRKAEAFLFTWAFSSVGVGLGGQSRIGKSYCVFELARRVEETGKHVVTIKDQDIGRLVRENSPKRDAMLRDVGKADCVVWDDFGLSKMTDAVEGTYNDLLEMINSRNIPILGTTNAGGQETKEKWANQMKETSFLGYRGERMVGRFRERCNLKLIQEKQK